ncbi:MAG: hypothetical protein PUG54_08355 [Firmicutes bacterium]|nr:hypothetical protein [Bacillota bacterium]
MVLCQGKGGHSYLVPDGTREYVLRPPQGSDIPYVYQITSMYRIKIWRKQFSQFPDGIATGNQSVSRLEQQGNKEIKNIRFMP